MPRNSPATPRMGGPTFSLSHRLRRAVWALTWYIFGIWTPTPLHSWRRLLLRIFGAHISAKAKVYPGVKVWDPSNLKMEDYSCLGPGVNCYCMDLITLESFALVSQRAHLCAGTHNVDDSEFPLVTRPIKIGVNAWIAAEAFVGPGVTVYKDAVLGARAVTMKNLEPGMIYVGNPARQLRARSNHV